MQIARESFFNGRPTWAEVDLDALKRNYRTLDALLRPADAPPSRPRLIPVIKGNAYGHGAGEIARALSSAGATAFAVAIVEEGIVLRDAGIRAEIVVLEGVWPGQEREAVAYGLTPTLFSPRAVRDMEQAAAERAVRVPVHVKVDTGMNRLGAPWNDLGSVLAALDSARHLRVSGTFTHLACAEEQDQAFTFEQVARFLNALSAIREAGIDPGEIHVANSAGLLYGQGLRSWTARPGIALYGYPPAPGRRAEGFEPVLSLKTRIGHLHSIGVGDSVGYNRRFTASRRMRVATLPVGYADGFRRALGGRSRVIIRDRWADVLGTVSMDMTAVDVTDVPDAGEGDEVILLGRSSSCLLDADVWADLLGTIPYEVLCGISPRVPRVYRDSSQTPATSVLGRDSS
jgi:alanine racemase